MSLSDRMEAAYLHAIARQLFMGADTPRHVADDVAETLVQANLTGHDSHGILRIPAYLTAISDGRIHPAAEPAVINESANTLLLDGQHGFGHYTARAGMKLAIDKAKQANVGCVSFTNTGHIGRLGQYAELAAQAGCISIITHGIGGKNHGRVVPFGGAGGALSTNPVAVGIPTGDDSPFILDIATSVVAEGKLQVARSKNIDVPEGFIVDKHGVPSVKTADFYDGGFLLPFGAHKGYGLGLMVALLGGLSGGFNLTDGTVRGEFMQVINVAAFTPLDDYQIGVRTFLDNIKTIPPAPGFAEVLVPGDFEHRMRTQRLSEGIDVPQTIQNQLQEWAAKLDVSLAEDIVDASDKARYE